MNKTFDKNHMSLTFAVKAPAPQNAPAPVPPASDASDARAGTAEGVSTRAGTGSPSNDRGGANGDGK